MHRVFPNPERASDRQAANPVDGQQPADQAASGLSSCRRGTGANGAGEASWDVRRRRRERDKRRREGDGLDQRRGCENSAGSGVPDAARGKMVIRLRRFVSRCCGGRRPVIRSQAQCVRVKSKGEIADAVCRTDQYRSMEPWSRELHQESDKGKNDDGAAGAPVISTRVLRRGATDGVLQKTGTRRAPAIRA
jgi:hypothetical protein